MLVIGDRPSPPGLKDFFMKENLALYFVFLPIGREQRPLCHVGVTDKQTWLVKSSTGGAAVSGGGVQLTEV